MLCGCLFLILLHSLVKSYDIPMNPIHYLKGVVDPDVNPLSSQVIDGCLVVVTEKGTHCTGQECQKIPEKFPNDNATIITFKYTIIEKIPTKAFAKNPHLQTLEIIQSEIKVIDEGAFSGLANLRLLNLAVNEITHISASALSGLENLQELILMKNSISSISALLPAILPSVLPSLVHLDLSSNRLVQIGKSDFSGMEESPLKYLVLFLCDLEEVHPDAFKPLRRLRGLSLRGNDKLKIKQFVSLFESDYFRNLREVDISAMTYSKIPTAILNILGKRDIQVLFLGGMRFSQIFVNQFPPMPKLESLYLNNDRITSIENGSLSEMTNLKTIFLKRNIMTELSPALLLPTLEELDVSGFPSQIMRFTVPDCSFQNMDRLRNLSLNFKGVLIKKNTFCGLGSLKRLSLRKCGITSIELESFMHFRSLEHLDISMNDLFQSGHVGDLAFDGLQDTLKTFIGQDIGMEDSDVGILQTLNSVEVLDLSNNSLTSINFLSKNLTMLINLIVPYNFIEMWDDSFVVEEVYLESLDLSHNDIRSVNDVMMDDFDSLLRLNLSHNPFQCSCNILPFVSWLNRTNVTVDHYHTATSLSKARQDNYICSGPSQLVHTQLYELPDVLNRKCNNITPGKPSHAVLISLAVLLIIVLGIVVVIYVFRKHLVYYWTREKTPEGTYIYDAFVSYSAVDSQWVFDALLPRLENTTSNLRLCVYDRDFLVGTAITDCILESIRNSRKIILVLSNNFLLSPWCRLETELASHILVDEKRDGLLLIKMEELRSDQISQQLKFLLQTRLHLTWSHDVSKQQEFWTKLQQALHIQNRTNNGAASHVV